MGTKDKSAKREAELAKALAVLISSTHSKRRQLPLTEISKWVECAVNHLGSYAAVADRIGLSSKMLRQFSYVRRLTTSVQTYFRRRQLDSVDAATHLAMLTAADQQAVAKALASRKIDTIDVRAIAELRKLGNQRSIASLLRQVSKSKVKQEYIAEFVVRGSRSRKELLAAFSRYIPVSEIVTLETKGALGKLVLTASGKQALAKAARNLRVPLKQVIPTILRS